MRRRLVQLGMGLLVVVSPVALVGGPLPIDSLAGDYLQFYGFLQQGCHEEIWVYDHLHDVLQVWSPPEKQKPGPKESRALTIDPSDIWSSGGLVITHGGEEPACYITRVIFWWPRRPKSVLPTPEFVERVLWPTLVEHENSFFGSGSDPRDRELYDSIFIPLQGESRLTIQDRDFDKAILSRMREFYPDGKGPWGVYVEAYALNFFCPMY